MNFPTMMAAAATSMALLAGCGEPGSGEAPAPSSAPAGEAGTHVRADGTTHADHGAPEPTEEQDHHEEISIGTVKIGGMDVALAQSHGRVAAGREGHLVVKLPYSDRGATIVRAWIGTKDRTLSYVGKGEYAASHDEYDIHATAPDPLPENVMWWIEIQKPDGSRVVGSATPIL